MTAPQADLTQLALKWGPAWALTALLIYFMMGSVTTSQAETHALLSQHVNDARLDAQRIVSILKANCLNEADTDGERALCLEAAR
jgi:hypothetical protein